MEMGGRGMFRRPGLVNIQKTMENHHFLIFLMGKLTMSMAIFNSYVSLPEGNQVTSDCGEKPSDSPVFFVEFSCFWNEHQVSWTKMGRKQGQPIEFKHMDRVIEIKPANGEQSNPTSGARFGCR